LVEAHLHSLILGARGEDLPSEINTWVDVESGGTGGLTADMQAKLNSFVTANRATLVTAGKQAFADVIGGGSVPSDIVEDVVDRFIDDFAREWKAFTDELNE